MTDLVITNLGRLTSSGSGYPKAAKSGGTHTAAITVVGSGSVAVAGAVMGSNDGVNFTSAGAFNQSGTAAAVAIVALSNDYAFWRLDISSMTGSYVDGIISTDGESGGAVRPDNMPYHMGRNGVTPYYGQIGTKCRGPQTLDATKTQASGRKTLTLAAAAVAGAWQIEFPNFCSTAGTGEAGPGAAATINAAVEYPRGTLTRLTFNGSNTGTIPDNGRLLCDPIGFAVPEGTKVRVEYLVNCPSGIVLAYGVEGQLDTTVTGDNCQLGTGALIDNTMTLDRTITNTTGAQGYGPCAVLSWTVKTSVFGNGDSLFRGSGDGGYAQASYLGQENFDGYVGYAERSLGRQCAFIMCGVGGETAQSMAAASPSYYANRLALSKYCSMHLMNFAANDLNTSRTGAQIIADLNTVADNFGLPAYWCTVLPVYPSTTDGYTTHAGMAANANNAQRVVLNTAARAGQIKKLSGVFDTARIAEKGKDSGIWWTVPNARVVTDGVANASSKTVQSASAAFTPDDLGKMLYFAGAGAAGGNLAQYITKYNSATSVDVFSAAGTTVASGGTIRIGYNQATADGVHAAATIVQMIDDSRVIDVSRARR